MKTLTTTNAVITYNAKVHAVRDISFAVSEGETLAIVGESGSGKSSIARVLAGLQSLTSGTVAWTGEHDDTFRAAPIEGARVGDAPRVQMVFQHPDSSLNPRWSVAKSVAEPLVRLGVKSREYLDRHTAEMLELVGLGEDFLARRPKDLSGGQAQRVAIARALISSPNIVVLDEPTASLDQTVRARLLATLAQLQQSLGTGYLMVTHDMSSVARLADRVLVMRKGRVVEQGPTDVILNSPLHPYTRALIDAVPPIDPDADWDPLASARDLAEEASVCPIPGPCDSHYAGLNEVAPGHLVECLAVPA
jgi:ABC-type glutathione transport system ATPase component